MNPNDAEQDLTRLHGRGVYYPGEWRVDSICPTNFLDNTNPDAAAYIAFCDQLLASSRRTRLLSNFAGICQTFMTANKFNVAYSLETDIHCEFIRRLLDIPSMTGLHVRLTYITELCDYLRRHLAANEALTGEQTFAAQALFVDALQEELQRRHDAWVAEIRARCPVTREQLTAIVWHPRRVAHHLAAADGDEAAEAHLFSGWCHESVGVALQGAT